mgnify:CR=1 FL=1
MFGARLKAGARAGEAILDGNSAARALNRYWWHGVLLAWIGIAAWYLWQRWGAVQALSLGDTDDNMRLMEVRAWLAGQPWSDLCQYRLNPPGGLDIHWSRLVDLPLAGLILLFEPLVGTGQAERLACGIAPLLPLAVTLAGIALAVRRLVAPAAWPLAIPLLFACGSALSMFMPLRIDHHGWQLALLSLTVAGLADPRRARGGAVIGLSSAASLTIGLELLPYCVMAGAIVGLRWVWDRGEARRLSVYGLSLAGGAAAGFAAFASDANWAMRCDALTPVWLSAVVAGGALVFALALLPVERRGLRLLLLLAAGAVLGGAFAGMFPHCLQRPEGVSDELARTWLNNVREAKPIYRHPLHTGLRIGVVPLIGLVGALIATWRARGSERFVGWAAVSLFTAFALLMLLWQVRSGPAAQVLSLVGSTALAVMALGQLLRGRPLVRLAGVAAVALLVAGLFLDQLIRWTPVPPPSRASRVVALAGARCMRLSSLRALDALPRSVMFTHVDLGPRLIVGTHHDGIAGPYHRNGDAILDVHHAFQRSPDAFRSVARRHGARYLLTCPNMAETTVYRARSPRGFYAQLARGRVPGWLEPVALPPQSPYRLWRIRY